MKKIFVTLLLLTSVVSKAEDKNLAYDLKGLRLGDTLTSVRASTVMLPEPNVEYGYRASKTIIPAAFVCTNDENAKRLLIYENKEYYDTGAIKCQYVYETGIERFAKVYIADYPSKISEFRFFAKTTDAEPVLYKMQFRLHSDAFDVVAVELIKKYGKPSKQTSDVIQNRMGAKFRNQILIWNNKKSSIVIEKYYSDLDTSSIEYTLKEYEVLVDLMEKRLSNSDKSKM